MREEAIAKQRASFCLPALALCLVVYLKPSASSMIISPLGSRLERSNVRIHSRSCFHIDRLAYFV